MTRKEGWIHVLSGLRSISRHLSVDCTKPRILRNLPEFVQTAWDREVGREEQSCTYRGSKSAKSARILSALPSAVHDSTEPSSGCASTTLYSFFPLFVRVSAELSAYEAKSVLGSTTYDIIRHDVPRGPHPSRHVRHLDQLSQLRVF